MKFPNFWIRVENPKGTVAARGWSDTSLEEATRNAQERLQRILAALRSHKTLDLDRYSYEIDRVICEEVIDRVYEQDEEIGVVSRNSYGSLVLNASRMMFVDVDFPTPSRPTWFARWFSKPVPPPLTPQEIVMARVREWQSRHPDFTLRIYRTLAGLRIVVVNRSFATIDDPSIIMMQELGSDALYVTLCQSQACFRARLTPKPWRVGLPNPPKRFPFDVAEDRHVFEKWSQDYVHASRAFKVCTLLETLGDGSILPEHLNLIQLHDSLCCSQQDLPLA